MMKRVAIVTLLLTILSGVVGSVWLFTHKKSPLFKPIQDYQITSELTFIPSEEVDEIMSRYLGLSFWEVELDVIQAELTRLDWANQARVKRHWPDLLYVSIDEQKPVARWGGSALINQVGEVFYPKELYGFDNLVLLNGELSDSERILESLVTFQEILNPIKLTISALKRQLDGVWRIELTNGSKVILDSKEVEQKLKIFVLAYSKLAKTLRKSPQVYDLRYSNGFIVGKAPKQV